MGGGRPGPGPDHRHGSGVELAQLSRAGRCPGRHAGLCGGNSDSELQLPGAEPSRPTVAGRAWPGRAKRPLAHASPTSTHSGWPGTDSPEAAAPAFRATWLQKQQGPCWVPCGPCHLCFDANPGTVGAALWRPSNLKH